VVLAFGVFAFFFSAAFLTAGDFLGDTGLGGDPLVGADEVADCMGGEDFLGDDFFALLVFAFGDFDGAFFVAFFAAFFGDFLGLAAVVLPAVVCCPACGEGDLVGDPLLAGLPLFAPFLAPVLFFADPFVAFFAGLLFAGDFDRLLFAGDALAAPPTGDGFTALANSSATATELTAALGFTTRLEAFAFVALFLTALLATFLGLGVVAPFALLTFGAIYR